MERKKPTLALNEVNDIVGPRVQMMAMHMWKMKPSCCAMIVALHFETPFCIAKLTHSSMLSSLVLYLVCIRWRPMRIKIFSAV